jgi:hypothetical protein
MTAPEIQFFFQVQKYFREKTMTLYIFKYFFACFLQEGRISVNNDFFATPRRAAGQCIRLPDKRRESGADSFETAPFSCKVTSVHFIVCTLRFVCSLPGFI